jgi:phage FluMu protein gp41
MTERSNPISMANVDPRVHDSDALEEIELYAEMIIVAGASSGPLTVQEIDEALGVVPVDESRT